MIDYHLTVGSCIGLAALLPNTRSDHSFSFEMELQKPHTSFKPKHAMLGFDPAGSMLYIGRRLGDDVFLAMAPNLFLRGHTHPCAAGHSSGSSLMSRRHYRQVLMMVVYFLAQIPQLSFYNTGDVYDQDLEYDKPYFDLVTNALYVLFVPAPTSMHSPFKH
jgi:hypothetical protein